MGVCTHPPYGCFDRDPCTDDTCTMPLGCTFQPINCDDGDLCTDEVCDPTAGCLHPPIACDDGDACTADSCDPGTGCAHPPIDCDDGNACTTDSCTSGTGCAHEPVVCPCAADTCQPASGCPSTGACVDDFACYQAKPFGTPSFAGVSGLPLEDAFGALTGEVGKPVSLCAPANTNDQYPSAPSHPDHLAGYRLKAPKFPGWTGLTVVNQFGTLLVDAKTRDRLLVPSAKSVSSPPGLPSPPDPDSFASYKVRPAAGERFTPVLALLVADQFETTRALCTWR